MLSYPAAEPSFTVRIAASSSNSVNSSGQSPSCPTVFKRQYCRHSLRTVCRCDFDSGAFATWRRWLAKAFGLTAGLDCPGGHWEAPNRRIRLQLFRLEWVKLSFSTDSSRRLRLAASRDSIRWSAMSRFPDPSYSSRRAWHSTSKHGV